MGLDESTKENIRERAVKEPFLIPYAIAALLIMVSVTVLLFASPRSRIERARINGIEVVENIPRSEIDNILVALSGTLELNTNERISRIRDIEVREGSYRQYFEGEEFFTSFIVDIESLRQSYRIINAYSPSVSDLNDTDYRQLARCIFGDDVIFPEFEFNCQDRISAESGMPRADPIQNVLPYRSVFYSIGIGISTETKIGLGIFINMPNPAINPERATENDIFVAERTKREALDKIRELGFNPDDYIIEYSWRF